MKQVYLAGAMEAYGDGNEAKIWRQEAEQCFYCCDTNFRAISPVDYYVYSEQYHKNDSEIFRFDLHKIKQSDVVLVNLENIRKSIGTSDEILYAYMNDIPVVGFLETPYELNEEEIIKEIHPWKYIQINRIETGKDAMKKAIEYLTFYYR